MRTSPVAHRPEKAVRGFLRTNMDVLALGPWVVRKERAAAGGKRARPEEVEFR